MTSYRPHFRPLWSSNNSMSSSINLGPLTVKDIESFGDVLEATGVAAYRRAPNLKGLAVGIAVGLTACVAVYFLTR